MLVLSRCIGEVIVYRSLDVFVAIQRVKGCHRGCRLV